uniref:Uncharacterized protein n=1 Tax=Anguilla anguilla TaxID=7936 RepID=A0A0E9R8R4_ANGAN
MHTALLCNKFVLPYIFTSETHTGTELG